MQHAVAAPYELRIFNRGKRRERANLPSGPRTNVDSLDLFNPADVHYVTGRKQFLLHRRQQVSAAGQDREIVAMPGQVIDRLPQRPRTEKFECGKTHVLIW